ncbi:MAG TPA: nitroreductase [Rhizomicrobium sp.]|nr:nitroreductase [Rhizomicrobium sp.]
MNVRDAILTRKSVRAFRPDPVPEATIRDILAVASRAATGGNLQPWRVHVLSGEGREELLRRVAAKRAETPMGEPPQYKIYPPDLTEPFRSRRFRVGEMMYATVNIPREDKAARLNFFAKNWEFFGAPVGLIVTMDRQMQEGQWADLGMFLQNVMLMARSHGLHSCAQESWAVWHNVVREYLKVPENEIVFCGMALGYADETAPVNTLVSERASVDEFASFVS